MEEKINRLTYAVVKLKRFLHVNHKALIYKGLIKPSLKYGLAIWGHKPTKKIETTHKKIIRTLNSKPRHAHTDPLMKKLKILKLIDLYK